MPSLSRRQLEWVISTLYLLQLCFADCFLEQDFSVQLCNESIASIAFSRLFPDNLVRFYGFYATAAASGNAKNVPQ